MQFSQLEMWSHNAFYGLDAMGLLDNASPALTMNQSEFDELVQTTGQAEGVEHRLEEEGQALVVLLPKGTVYAYSSGE